MGHPFGRAVRLHHLLSDVHPFVDGNGRISRIMMTKELLASGLSRLRIPRLYGVMITWGRYER
jgi:Fic family protein